jgi:transcription elongation factor Elf1
MTVWQRLVDVLSVLTCRHAVTRMVQRADRRYALHCRICGAYSPGTE